jgi:hypothetical protein
MIAEKGKRKGMPRSIFPLFAVGMVCLLVGAAAGWLLHPPEKPASYPNPGGIQVNVNTTPYTFYRAYAAKDIPCGARMDALMYVETMPEQIVITGLDSGRTYFPMHPIWNVTPYPDEFFGSSSRYANRRIARGNVLSERDFVSSPPVCSTPVPGS